MTNPHLNGDPGKIIAFPDETFGLKGLFLRAFFRVMIDRFKHLFDVVAFVATGVAQLYVLCKSEHAVFAQGAQFLVMPVSEDRDCTAP
ncbi:MAG: hypothetical protein PVJ68_02830 [Candidatus Thiodiazotropha sp.]|jgi:hypothetical protein